MHNTMFDKKYREEFTRYTHIIDECFLKMPTQMETTLDIKLLQSHPFFDITNEGFKMQGIMVSIHDVTGNAVMPNIVIKTHARDDGIKVIDIFLQKSE